MSNIREITVAEDDHDQRLDRWIKKYAPDLPYALVQKLLRKGQIRVDGKRCKPDTRLGQGQTVRLPPKDHHTRTVTPDRLNDKDRAFVQSLVIYDDGEIIALNKPAGLAVQGGTGMKHHLDRLLPALNNDKAVTPRLVHRLDKETSGVLLLARSADMARKLGGVFKGRAIRKIYYGLSEGVPDPLQGTIRAPLLKKSSGRDKEKIQIDDEDGKNAITDYQVIDSIAAHAALIAFWPRTGRTHQIRVHATDVLGCPLVGDPKYKKHVIGDYGDDETNEDNVLDSFKLSDTLHLHAASLEFEHPSKPKQIVKVSAPLPPAFTKSLKILGLNARMKETPFENLE